MEDRQPRGLPPILIFIAVFAVVAARFGQYGPAMHELAVISGTERLMDWMKGSLSTEAAWFGSERPSPAKLLAAAGWFISGGRIEGLRFFPGLLYAAAVARVYSAIRIPRGPQAGYAAAAILVFLPVLFAASAQAALESVLASIFLLAFVSAAQASKTKEWFVVGMLLGIGIGTKITGLLGLLAVVTWCLLYRPIGRPRMGNWAGLLAGTGSGFLLSWPPLLWKPLFPFRHVGEFAAMARPPVLFFGELAEPPLLYPVVWLLVGVTPVVLALAALELFARPRTPFQKLLIVFVTLSAITALISHQFLREGIRHLIPLIVVIAVLAGMGIGRVGRVSRVGAGILIAISVFSMGAGIARFHPAEESYVSELAGGAAGMLDAKMPVTSSISMLDRDLLARLDTGVYFLHFSPRASETPPDFLDISWRRHLSRHAYSSTGREIRFGSATLSERILLIGSGKTTSLYDDEMLRRDGAVYVSVMPNPMMSDSERESLEQSN